MREEVKRTASVSAPPPVLVSKTMAEAAVEETALVKMPLTPTVEVTVVSDVSASNWILPPVSVVPVAEPATDLRTIRAVSLVPVETNVVSKVVKASVEVFTVSTPPPVILSAPPVLSEVVAFTISAERVPVITPEAREAAPEPEMRSTPPVLSDVVAFRMSAESWFVTTAESSVARPVERRVAACKLPVPVAFVKVNP
jgi:hypothetical protein